VTSLADRGNRLRRATALAISWIKSVVCGARRCGHRATFAAVLANSSFHQPINLSSSPGPWWFAEVAAHQGRARTFAGGRALASLH